MYAAQLHHLLITAVILAASVISAQVEKPKIGVMNFEADEANATLARQATVALTAALVNTRMFEVLDQSSMAREFLTGIARQHAERERFLETLRGEACTETQCLADLGYALEARFMVTGNLTRTPRATTVAVRLVDVFSTSILAYPTRTYGGDVAASLDTSIAGVAAELVHALPGEVYLYGLPLDARVTVDSKPVTWRSDRPLELTPGRHEIGAKRRGFGEATVRVDAEYNVPAYREIPLPRKGAGSALARSLVLPGWGQFYSERSARGTLFLVAEVAALGGVGYTAYANIAANSDYDDAKAQYVGLTASNVTQAQLDAARRKMLDAYDKTKSTKNLGLVALGVFAGIHLLDVLDAAIGFPNVGGVQLVPRPSGASLIEIRFQLARRDGR